MISHSNPEDKVDKFELTREEVKYIVENIQHEYLSKENYYQVIDMIKRMEKFLEESDNRISAESINENIDREK